MFTLKNYLLLFAGLLIGIATSSLFKGCQSSTLTLPISNTTKPTTFTKEVAQIEKQSQQQIDSLTTHSQQLKQQLKTTTQSLTQVRLKNNTLQMQLYGLIDKQQTAVDTIEQLSTCDSLSVKVVDLLQSVAQQDSLCMASTDNLIQQLRNKDSALQVKDNQYRDLKVFWDKSLLQQEILFSQNKNFQKQFKRQKVKRKILSAVILVLSGVTANYILQH